MMRHDLKETNDRFTVRRFDDKQKNHRLANDVSEENSHHLNQLNFPVVFVLQMMLEKLILQRINSPIVRVISLHQIEVPVVENDLMNSRAIEEEFE